jgi:hypothetical protein
MDEPIRRPDGDPVITLASAPGAARDWGYLAIAYAPFLLNDFAFLGIDFVGGWLAIDYGTRVMSLAIIFGLPALRIYALKSDRRQCSRTLLIALAAAAAISRSPFCSTVLPRH